MAGARSKPNSSGRFQGFFINQYGRKEYFTGSAKRSETLRIARKLEDDARQVRLGYREPRKTHFKYRDKSIIGTKQEYIEWGKLQGGRGGRPWSDKHHKKKESSLDLWVETLGLKVIGDLDGILPRVEATLQELSKRGKTGKTLINTLEPLQSFLNWCLIRNYLGENPLKGISKIDSSPKNRRRSMTVDEFRKLLEVAPPHRRILYIIAAITGLRANELRSLTRDHLDTRQKGPHLDADWTKDRKPGFQPLPEATAKLLVEFFDSGIVPLLYSKYVRTKVFEPQALLYVPHEPSKRVDIDLEAAGIKKSTAKGKLDFHAIRSFFVTSAIEVGGTAKEVQKLARHSDPRITMNIYAHARDEGLASVVDRVANAVLPSGLGAHLVQSGEWDVTQEKRNLLSEKEVTEEEKQWRRGESNPHLRDATASCSRYTTSPGSTRVKGHFSVYQTKGKAENEK